MIEDRKIANDVYAKAIRATVCKMFVARRDGHIGGSFSIADVLAVLFNSHIRDGKDWFVLSKGHAGPAYYASLYLEHKIPEESICTLNENGTILPSHPDRNLTPGVQCSTGSLGQGISQAIGLAYANKIKNNDSHVYCIIGDGELNEGETYEALQFAANKKLGNLIIFVDANKQQVDGFVKDVSCDYKYESLFEGIGLKSQTIDGHDVDLIDRTINEIETNNDGECHVVVLDTIKGKGIKYFEGTFNNHHVNFNEEELNLLNTYYEENKGVIEDVMETTR